MQMDLETYKRAVRESLIKDQNCTPEYADKLMAAEDGLMEDYYNDYRMEPVVLSCAIVMGYL